MPQVSHRKPDKNIQIQLEKLFTQSLLHLDKNTLDSFASDLFTHTERIMFAKRISVAHLLLQGYQYRDIGDILKVSTNTVLRIKTVLDLKGEGYKTIIKAVNQRQDTLQNIEKFFLEFFGGRSHLLREMRKFPR